MLKEKTLEIIRMLEIAKYEKLCLGCWMNVIKPYLDKRLVLSQNIFCI